MKIVSGKSSERGRPYAKQRVVDLPASDGGDVAQGGRQGEYDERDRRIRDKRKKAQSGTLQVTAHRCGGDGASATETR